MEAKSAIRIKIGQNGLDKNFENFDFGYGIKGYFQGFFDDFILQGMDHTTVGMYLSNCAIYQASYATRHILALTNIRRNVEILLSGP
jgi:hypothetical protein